MGKRRQLLVSQHIGKRDCCLCRLKYANTCLAFDEVLSPVWYRYGFGYRRCQPCLRAEKGEP